MIGNRLKNLERQVHGRACAACAAAPRCVLADSPNACATVARQMRDREERCTCGRPFHLKVITIDRAVAA